MKLWGEKSINYPIKAPRVPICNYLGTKNLGTERVLLCLLPTRYQVFWNCMSIVDDLLGPIVVFKNRYRVVQGYFMKQIVALK